MSTNTAAHRGGTLFAWKDTVHTITNSTFSSNYGGPTLTHLAMVGNPVIDAGNNSAVPDGLTRDQRGSLYMRFDGTSVDLKAVEITGALAQEICYDSFEN